jgi:hypothetical protein
MIRSAATSEVSLMNYLPEREVSNRYTVTNVMKWALPAVLKTVTGNDDVTVRTSHKPCDGGLCDGVTVRKGEHGTPIGTPTATILAARRLTSRAPPMTS